MMTPFATTSEARPQARGTRRGRTGDNTAYALVCERLRQSIRNNEFSTGRLPTERVLCVRHAVSVGTVRKAIDLLVREGVVTRRQGSGTYVSRPSGVRPLTGSRRTHLLCYLSGTGTESCIGNFFNRLMVAVQGEIDRAGYATVITSAAGGRVPMPIAKQKVDGVIVAGTYRVPGTPGSFTAEHIRENNDLIRRVVEVGIPVVTVSNPTDCQSAYRIDPDYDQALHDALSNLKQMGHRRVAVYGGPRTWPAFGQRIDAFLRQSAILGLETGDHLIAEYHDWAHRDRDAIIRRVRDHVASHPGVTAGIVISGSPTLVQQGLIAAGLNPPRDFSLVSFADITRSEIGQSVFIDPDTEISAGMSTLNVPIYQLARSAVERLVAVLEGRQFNSNQQHIHVPLEFTPGISIQPVPSASRGGGQNTES